MGRDGKIVVNNKEYSVLATFEYRLKNFVIYTDYSKNKENKINIFASIYTTNNDEILLQKIIEKEDFNVVEEYIAKLEAELKN